MTGRLVWRPDFCRHNVNTGEERTPNESQHKTLTLDKKRTDKKEATKLDPPSCLSSSLHLSSFCCCLSVFFYLTKTLSVESARLFFSSFVVHWWVRFPSFFLTCLPHQHLLAFSSNGRRVKEQWHSEQKAELLTSQMSVYNMSFPSGYEKCGVPKLQHQ